jgi:hypothetical protein
MIHADFFSAVMSFRHREIGKMLLGTECRGFAAKCFLDARKISRHRSDLIRLARAWVKLARQIDRMNAEERSRNTEEPRCASAPYRNAFNLSIAVFTGTNPNRGRSLATEYFPTLADVRSDEGLRPRDRKLHHFACARASSRCSPPFKRRLGRAI